MQGAGVPAFLDKGYFCDRLELKKQFGPLRSKGFPDHPNSSVTEPDMGSPSSLIH